VSGLFVRFYSAQGAMPMPAIAKDATGATPNPRLSTGLEGINQPSQEAPATLPAATSDDLTNMTPREGPRPTAVPTDSRFAALQDGSAREGGKLVNLLYLGRKATFKDVEGEDDADSYAYDDGEGEVSTVRAIPEERISINVPSSRNRAAASMYLDQAAPNGSLTPAQRAEAAKAGFSHRTVHVAGTTVNFATGEVTPVDPRFVPWLLNHEAYAFKQVD